MEKDFDELTIADDYMFYRVMEDPEICKTLLNRVLQGKVGTITNIELQKTIDDAGRAKGVRFDVWAKDYNGRIYDIEMQALDKKDLAKRIRYYQAAIDVSLLGKSKPYESLPDTFILFFCTFDYLERALPVYTFKTVCSEDSRIELYDGVTKIIINSKAAAQEKNKKLKVFLEYMNGKVSDDDEFIQRLEQRIKEVKANEELRREYMLVNTIERDARNDGWKAGIAQGLAEGKSLGLAEGKSLGLAEGKSLGLAEGSHQKALETARLMRQRAYPVAEICLMTGLTKEEVAQL